MDQIRDVEERSWDDPEWSRLKEANEIGQVNSTHDPFMVPGSGRGNAVKESTIYVIYLCK